MVMNKFNQNALVIAVLATLIPQAYAYDNSGTLSTQQATSDVSVSNTGTIDLATPSQTYALQTTGVGGIVVNTGLIKNNLTVGSPGSSNRTTYNSTALKVVGNSSTVTNSGTLYGLNGISLLGSDISFTNSASGVVTAIGHWQIHPNGFNSLRYAGVYSNANNASIYNYGIIQGGGSAQAEAILTIGNNSYVYNAGVIKTETSADNPNTIQNAGQHATLINMGKIIAIGPKGPVGIYANNDEGYVTNGSYDLIHNAGSIYVKSTGVNGATAGIYNGWSSSALIAKINNTGWIIAEAPTGVTAPLGIINHGTIGELNNAQGVYGTGGTALTLGGEAWNGGGNLPNKYNMIVYGDAYGQLAVQSLKTSSTAMTFGIFGGDTANGVAPSVLNSRNYLDVMTGVPVAKLTNTFSSGVSYGTYGGTIYALSDATWRGGANTAWDLRVMNLSADLAVPQADMLTQRSQAIRTSLGYDCNYFDQNNVCVSVNGRYSNYGSGGNLSEGAGVLTASVLLEPSVRAGVFVDVGNVAEPKGVAFDNTTTTYGAFVGYSENKDGTGLQAKVSTSYQYVDAEFSRFNMSGAASSATGDADISTFGFVAQIGRGYALSNNRVLTPYLGIDYVRSKRYAYSDAGTGVGLAFSYNEYTLERTRAEVGVELKGKVEGKSKWPFYYHVGAALQHDIAYRLSDFNATGSISGINMLIQGSDGGNYIRARGFAGLSYEVKQGTFVGVDLNMQGLDNGEIASTILAGVKTSF